MARATSGFENEPAKQTALGAVILAALALVVFLPLTLHPTDLLVGSQPDAVNDLTAQWLAFRSFAASELASSGDYPTWNPYRRAGSPWLGNPVVAAFYPPNLLFLFLDAWPLAGWMLVLHHLWGALGAFFLVRALGRSRIASLCAGMVLLASPYLIAHTAEGHLPHLATVAWYPWVFLAYHRLRTSEATARTFSRTAALAVCLALALLAGHIQEWYYLVLALAGFALAHLLRKARSNGFARALRSAPRLALPVVAATGLSAVELLPIWIFSRQSVRAVGLAVEQPGAIGLGLANLHQLLDPHALGGPTDYAGPGLYYSETLLHFGVLPLGLALLAVIFSWRRPEVAAWAVLAAVSIAFAFGDGSPVFALFSSLVPGMEWFRGAARTLFLAALAMAVLAAFGLDWLLESAQRIKSVGRRQAAALGSCVTILCAAELTSKAWPAFETVPRASIRDATVAKMLQSSIGRYRVVAPQHLLSDREAWVHSLQKLQSYDSTPLLISTVVAEAMTADRRAIDLLLGFRMPELSALDKSLVDLLGIRYAVTSGEETQAPGWDRIAAGSIPAEFAIRGSRARRFSYRLHENQTAMPRAFALGKVRELPSGADPIVALRALDPRRELLLPRDVLPPGERIGFTPARILEYEANRVVVEIDLDKPGYLFLSDTWYPGWTARAGRRKLEVLRANVAFRAVPLPPGTHRVTFAYKPVGLLGGTFLSSLSLLALIAPTVLRRIRVRSTRRDIEP